MRIFWRVFRFEIKRLFARPGVWIGAALFFALGAGMLLLLAGVGEEAGITVLLGEGEAVYLNSPHVNLGLISAITFFGLIVTAALFGAAASYEYTHRMTPLFWTTRLTRDGAYWGRFAAALVVNLWVLSFTGLGFLLVSFLPSLDRSLFGPVHLYSYVAPYLLSVLPRTLLSAALIYLLVGKTRSTLSGHLAMVGLIGFYTVAGLILSQVENRTLAALLDPTGDVSLGLVTRTWSTAEKNSMVPAWEGLVLGNRVLWFAVSAALLLLARRLYRPEQAALGAAPKSFAQRLRALREEMAETNPLPRLVAPLTRRLPRVLRLAASEYRAVLLHPGFLVTLALAVFFFFVVAFTAGSNLAGTRSWPVTYQVAGVVNAVLSPFAYGLLLFFAGHLLWREKTWRVDGLMDVLPRSNWQPLFSKLLALAGAAVTIQLFAIFLGMVFQTFQGYFRYQLPVYAAQLLGQRLVDVLIWLALAVFLQVLLPRYAAYLVTVMLYLGLSYLPATGLDHILYRYNADPGLRYSELNGFGPFVAGWASAKLYWGAVACLLLVLTGLLWRRGVDAGIRERLAKVRRRTTPRVTAAAVALAVLAVAAGGWVFYNTNVLNTYLRRSTAEKLQAEMERKYRPALEEPQPRVVDTALEVDIFPDERRARVRGTYRLRNETGRPIARPLLALQPELEVAKLEFDRPARIAPAEPENPYRRVDLATPWQPGEEMGLTFDLTLESRGFANSQSGLFSVVENGTFLPSSLLLPGFGYDPSFEIADPRRRKKLELPRRDPLPPWNDPWGRANTPLSADSDRLPFRAVVSTSADQVALAPGDLVRRWDERGRRYFEYRSAIPILKFYAFISGRYAVKQDRAQGVDLAIYHHPAHSFNVDTMMAAMKASLASFSQHFGAYPHKTLRIVEFPRYASFAQSFPTLIPFSEEIGFIARRKKPEDIDYPFYVTAHEVAHQWWGHQVTAARTEGATFLIESLAQDSALRVMEEQLGAKVMGRFLRYELDRYLAERSTAVRDEVPLLRVQNQQFIHYQKGSLVMYNLAGLIGRQAVDAALTAYAGSRSHTGPPYPISLDLYRELEARTPAEFKATLSDLFERITLFDLETREASCKPLPGGSYRVTFDVEIDKGYADGTGNLKKVPPADWIDVAVMAEERTSQGTVPKPLVLERRKLEKDRLRFEYVVKEKPVRAGLDPFFKIVDRQPENNTQKLNCGGTGLFGR